MAEFNTAQQNSLTLIQWKDYNAQLVSEVQDLYGEDAYCDCTLWADGISRDCHRIVLSAHSIFLRQLLENSPNDRPILTLDNVNKDELNALVEFMYTGATSIHPKKLLSFLKTCSNLKISGLMDCTFVNEEWLESSDTENSQTEVTEPVLKQEKVEYIIDEEDSLLRHELLDTVEVDDSNKEQERTLYLELDDELMEEEDEEPWPGDSTMEENYNQQDNEEEKTSSKMYACKQCGNKYSHRRTLLHHLHWICNQPATYCCPLCPYMGKRKYQVKSHVKHFHKKEVKITEPIVIVS